MDNDTTPDAEILKSLERIRLVFDAQYKVVMTGSMTRNELTRMHRRTVLHVVGVDIALGALDSVDEILNGWRMCRDNLEFDANQPNLGFDTAIQIDPWTAGIAHAWAWWVDVVEKELAKTTDCDGPEVT